jgi:hypothetical protein
MNKPYFRPLCLATLLAVGAMSLSACGVSVASKPTPTPGPQDIVKSYETAFNKKDLAGLMALHSDQIQFSLPEWGYGFYTYEAAKNAYSVYFELNAEMHLSDCQLDNDSVKCQQTYAEDILRSSGLKEYTINSVYTIEAGKIKKIVWNDPGIGGQVSKDWNNFESAFFAWWQKNYPDEANQILAVFWRPGNGLIVGQRVKEYTETQQK